MFITLCCYHTLLSSYFYLLDKKPSAAKTKPSGSRVTRQDHFKQLQDQNSLEEYDSYGDDEDVPSKTPSPCKAKKSKVATKGSASRNSSTGKKAQGRKKPPSVLTIDDDDSESEPEGKRR